MFSIKFGTLISCLQSAEHQALGPLVENHSLNVICEAVSSA
jgi:hypothetical protein